MMVTKTDAVKNKPTSLPTSQTSPAADGAPPIKMEIIEEFIVASSAPVDVAAKLSRAFFLSSNREKEQAKGLLECSNYCESLAVELLELCRYGFFAAG